jgi:outer membrane protein assembly factor BamB
VGAIHPVWSGSTPPAPAYTTARRLWLCDLGGDCTATPAIGQGGVLYIGTENGKLFAINTEGTYTDDQQRIKWTCNIGAGETRHLRSSPAVCTNGTIYVGTKVPAGVQTQLVAVNPTDGGIKWTYEPSDRSVSENGNDFYSSPAVGFGGRIYVGCETNYVYALEPDGTLAWKFKTSQDMTWPSPVIDDNGVLYIGNMAGDFYAIQTDSFGLANSPWPRFRNNKANTARYSNMKLEDDV